MKASLTLREDPEIPLVKAKIPLSICVIPFLSGIQAGEYRELCISFSTALCSGPLLKFCYRPNDSCHPFGLTLRTGVGQFGSPSGSPVSMSVEFNLIGNSCRPSFLLHFKPRSGDFSVRRSVESSLVSFSSLKSAKSLRIQNGVVPGEKLNWDQLLSSAYGVLSDGEVRATTAVPVNQAVVKVGWSMRFPPPCGDGDGDGGLTAENLLKELPYLVLKKIAIERVAGDKAGTGKKRDLLGKGGDVAKARLGLIEDRSLENERNMEFEAHNGGKQPKN